MLHSQPRIQRRFQIDDHIKAVLACRVRCLADPDANSNLLPRMIMIALE